MPDKQLLRLLGEDKRYIYRAVAWMLTGSLSSIGFTACLCYGLHLLLIDARTSFYLLPFALGAVCAAVRFLATTRAAAVRDRLGRSVKKNLRAQLYAKLLRLGVRETKTVKMAGLTQLATEGIEQLDLYYSSYLPQFFYAMLSPLLLFGICVFLNWRVAAVLLACVPLIPVSIVAVSRFAKRIFAKYWGKYTAMGDVFLDSVQGLKELKLFRADARRQAYMNENAEEFRKITMKVFVMQLASVTIMDLVAFGGAGVGAALAVTGTQNGGGIAAALFLVLVAAEFFLPLRAFGSAFHVAMNGVSAGRMMLTLLEEPEPAWGKVQPCGGRLELEDVHFSYAPGRETLHGVSAVFPERGMTAVVGESGCGKTTAAKLLTGALRPGSGRVLLDGKPIDYNKIGLGYLPEERGLYPKKPVIDQLAYFAELKGMSAKEAVRAVDYWLGRLGMTEYRNKRLDTLSKGNQQKIQLITALAHNPHIVILDEPFSGLDPVNAMLLKDVVKEQISQGKIVLFSSHQMAYIEEFCDSIAILSAGRVAISGDLIEIKRNYVRDKLVVSTTNPERIKSDLGKACAEREDGTLLIQLTSPAEKQSMMKRLVESYDIDEVKVFEPSLNDIFVEHAGAQV